MFGWYLPHPPWAFLSPAAAAAAPAASEEAMSISSPPSQMFLPEMGGKHPCLNENFFQRTLSPIKILTETTYIVLILYSALAEMSTSQDNACINQNELGNARTFIAWENRFCLFAPVES